MFCWYGSIPVSKVEINFSGNLVDANAKGGTSLFSGCRGSQELCSPRIDSCRWGEIRVGGKVYKDAKIYPGGSGVWDWGKTGTCHDPGIQVTDVQELFDHSPTDIVLSKGMEERLKTRPDTLDFIKNNHSGVKVHHLPTKQAVEEYNALVKAGKRPAGLFHSTC